MDWNPTVASQALEMFQDRVGALLYKFSGYLVS